MSSVINQLRMATEFCCQRSIDPQAIEACQNLGLHIRLTAEDFDRLQPSNTTHTVFGGDNPWLLRTGYIDSIEIRCHQSIEPELARAAAGDRAYITAQSFGDRFASNLTDTLDISSVNKEVHHA